mmetsp:Transcript_6561/g.14402  ORF Transcript_6561/g.14402 Transcript_6561/m.14402 type:complete len:249 (-) Transcript_6561:1194-1940(-)
MPMPMVPDQATAEVMAVRRLLRMLPQLQMKATSRCRMHLVPPLSILLPLAVWPQRQQVPAEEEEEERNRLLAGLAAHRLTCESRTRLLLMPMLPLPPPLQRKNNRHRPRNPFPRPLVFRPECPTRVLTGMHRPRMPCHPSLMPPRSVLPPSPAPRACHSSMPSPKRSGAPAFDTFLAPKASRFCTDLRCVVIWLWHGRSLQVPVERAGSLLAARPQPPRAVAEAPILMMMPFLVPDLKAWTLMMMKAE